MFRENLGQEESENMDDLTTQAQSYINYEDNVLSKDIERNKAFRNKKQGNNKGRENEDKERHKGPQFRFLQYTPLKHLRTKYCYNIW